MSTCHFRLQSQDTSVEHVIAFGDKQLVPQESAQTLGNQARQHTQAPSVPRAVVDPKTTALAARPALTPQAAALQSGLVQTATPRSREEIRKLFTRRSSSLQSAASLQQPSTNLHGSSHPASRLQHHSGPTRLEPVLPETDLHFQPVLAPQPANQLAHSHHVVSGHHEDTTAPALGNQAPGTFGHYAYPGSSSSHQTQRASGQSFHQSQQIVPQRNSAPSQRTSGSSHGNLADASAVARPSMSSGSGPTMRAEVLMGPAATIEVNVRFHANIAAALKRYTHTSVNNLVVNIADRSVYGYLAEPLMPKHRHCYFDLASARIWSAGIWLVCCCTCFSSHKCRLDATCTNRADYDVQAANHFHCMFHSLEGAEWISSKGLWRLPMSQYVPLMKALPAVPGVRLDVEPLPAVAQALVQV